MEQMKLFQWINMVSFAVNDIVLYLDTHPMDQEAIAYFNHFKEVRTSALKEYEECCGPQPILIRFCSVDGKRAIALFEIGRASCRERVFVDV